jgi:hypothetical protein
MIMAAHSRSLDTTADPSTLWRLWSDTSTWQEWNPDVQAVHLDGPFAPGTTGTMSTKSGGTHRIQIERVEPGRSFSLRASAMPLTPFVFHCEIAPTGSGGATISQGVTMQGPLAPIFSAMMGNQVANSFLPILQGLAVAAERADGKR